VDRPKAETANARPSLAVAGADKAPNNQDQWSVRPLYQWSDACLKEDACRALRQRSRSMRETGSDEPSAIRPNSRSTGMTSHVTSRMCLAGRGPRDNVENGTMAGKGPRTPGRHM
jgi:hypothetical protein